MAAVVALNVSAAWDYVQLGARKVSRSAAPVATSRAHTKSGERAFYIASGDTTPYYVWGDVSASLDRLSLFARGNQIGSPSTRPAAGRSRRCRRFAC